MNEKLSWKDIMKEKSGALFKLTPLMCSLVEMIISSNYGTSSRGDR